MEQRSHDGVAANQLGVEIDPEALLAQYRSGVPVEQLLAMPAASISPLPPEHGVSRLAAIRFVHQARPPPGAAGAGAGPS